ncbi:DUF3800 domain-containing protein [Sorangium sp. So ce118]
MSSVSEIYADEAWTHGSEPLRRYWCFYGGVFGSESNIGRLDTRLRAVKRDHAYAAEIKWSKLTPGNLRCYTDYVDCALDAIDAGEVKFRQMFHDRSYVREPEPGESASSDLDVQFKLCYQFLKHGFGLRHLERDSMRDILVRLDTHSSQKHKDQLESFAAGIPRMFSRSDLCIRTTFHDSEALPVIQACDLMIGAAGSYGNKMHKIREPGARGMTKKQKARLALCEHIYDRLRAIDAAARGSKAFNWFESTGLNGDRANLLHYKIRIWKFVPRRYRIDKGWQNDNLDKFGQYRGPLIGSEVLGEDPNDSGWLD